MSVTSVYSGENIIISNYSSKKELVDVSENLNLMLFLHVYSGMAPPLGTLDAAFDLRLSFYLEVTHSNQRPYLLQKHVDDYDEYKKISFLKRLKRKLQCFCSL